MNRTGHPTLRRLGAHFVDGDRAQGALSLTARLWHLLKGLRL